jgi:hydroxymethylbilane synthase
VTLRLGTRASALALAQARSVAQALSGATGQKVELVEITTEGDRSSAPIGHIGVGVFVSAIRDALTAKEIDLAVHSYKDLPTGGVDGLMVAAVPAREEPRDALVVSPALAGTPAAAGLAQLPAGARVATSAPRRIAQLRAGGRGLVCVPLRGNVDSRLRRLAAGEFDAIVIAAAGMHRLGRSEEITRVLDLDEMLPAPAQGALAVECRVDDHELVEALAGLHDENSAAEVAAERALLAQLGAGCHAAIAALAEVDARGGGVELNLRAAVFSPDGSIALRKSGIAKLAAASDLGRTVAAELHADGAEEVLGVAT